MDLLLYTVSQDLIAKGYKVSGAVQVNSKTCGHGKCDMDIKVLPDGPVIRISQSLGTGSRGCRLDTSGLETSVGHVSAHLETNPDFLIINKFGKQEAAGRGFRPVISDALLRGIPVLVGLNALNREAFLDYTEGCAAELPPTQDALCDWVNTVLSAAQNAA
jgi:hypothetical protein